MILVISMRNRKDYDQRDEAIGSVQRGLPTVAPGAKAGASSVKRCAGVSHSALEYCRSEQITDGFRTADFFQSAAADDQNLSAP